MPNLKQLRIAIDGSGLVKIADTATTKTIATKSYGAAALAIASVSKASPTPIDWRSSGGLVVAYVTGEVEFVKTPDVNA